MGGGRGLQQQQREEEENVAPHDHDEDSDAPTRSRLLDRDEFFASTVRVGRSVGPVAVVAVSLLSVRLGIRLLGAAGACCIAV